MSYDTTILERISIAVAFAQRKNQTVHAIYLGSHEYETLRNARSDRLRLVYLPMKPKVEAETYLDEVPVYEVNVRHHLAVG